jgi:hypothetical protein
MVVIVAGKGIWAFSTLGVICGNRSLRVGSVRRRGKGGDNCDGRNVCCPDRGGDVGSIDQVAGLTEEESPTTTVLLSVL